MPYINIGSSPHAVDCAQVGSHDYKVRATIELNAYKDQLTRLYPPPVGCHFAVKWFRHDFGSYGEVVAVYPAEGAVGVTTAEALACEDWASCAEDGAEYWDEIALKAVSEGVLGLGEVLGSANGTPLSWDEKALQL